MNKRVLDAIDELPEREKATIEHIYIDGCTQEQTAKDLGCSRWTVSRIRHKALARMRRELAE